jgi:AraC family transcriptional regulator
MIFAAIWEEWRFPTAGDILRTGGALPGTGCQVTAALGILRGDFGRVALLDMDTSLVPHAHHHCHIILKVSGPDQQFIVEGNALPVREDTAVLVNTWEQHQYLHQKHENRTVFLALYIEPEWLAGTDRSFARCSQPAFFHRSGVAVSGQIRRLRGKLVERINSQEYDPKEAEEMIFELTSEMAHQFADRSSRAGGRRTTNDFRIRRAVCYMQENFSSTFDLDSVAGVAGLSRPHFNHLFRHCTGVSPGVYGNAIRLEAAVSALSEQHEPIAAVAEELGFSAQSNFTRFFQQHTGIAPRQFRKSLAQIS